MLPIRVCGFSAFFSELGVTIGPKQWLDYSMMGIRSTKGQGKNMVVQLFSVSFTLELCVKHETSRCVLLSRLVPHIPLGKITFLLTGRTWLVLGPQLGIQFNWCVGFQRLMLELCLEHETSSMGN